MIRNTFEPNEDVISGFRRVAEAAQPKIKQYLLNKAGLATHDIRLLTAASEPFSLSTPETFEEHWVAHFFDRSLRNEPFKIVNASGTEPVVHEVHFFVELPNEVPVSFAIWEGSEKKHQTAFSTAYSFLEVEDIESFDTHQAPVLAKGVILNILRSFSVNMEFDLPAEIRDQAGNTKRYRPPEEFLERCRSAYSRILAEAQAWVGLVLDNEELLPYRWDHASLTYTPGFYSDAITVTAK